MESSSISSLQTFSITAGVKNDTQPQAITDSSSVSSQDGSKRKRDSAPLSQNVKDNEPNLSSATRTEYCEDYYLSEDGCTDDTCGKAHGDCEVQEPFFIPPKDAIVFRPITGENEERTGKCEYLSFHAAVFPYIDASHVGILFGQKGEIFQWLCNLTGVKVTVENNEEVPGFKKVVISGPLTLCLHAKVLLTTLLANFVFFSASDKIPPVLDYKGVLCKKYAEGCCEHDAGTCSFARWRSFELLEKALEARREGKYYNAATKTFVPKKSFVKTNKDSYAGHRL